MTRLQSLRVVCACCFVDVIGRWLEIGPMRTLTSSATNTRLYGMACRSVISPAFPVGKPTMSRAWRCR